MKIDGRRSFKYNGKRYYIANLLKADRVGNKKYYISIYDDGFFKIAHNSIDWSIDKFETIKEAQRYVRDWDFLLKTY